MNTLAFDTLKFANRLKAAGMEQHLAEEQAEALSEALAEQTQLATKTDLAETRTELIKWVAGMLVAQAALIAALIKLLG